MPEIKRPNKEGITHCVVRWTCNLGDGLWLGAWDKKAFSEYERLIREDEREKCQQKDKT